MKVSLEVLMMLNVQSFISLSSGFLLVPTPLLSHSDFPLFTIQGQRLPRCIQVA